MPDVMKHDEAESWDSDEKTWDKHIGEQFALMPPVLYRIDHIVIKATEWFLVAAGVLFTFLISYDVVSRYAFGSSSFFVSAAAKFLLLWFFLLGAGLALRQGAHVGFELLLNSLKPRRARAVKLVGQILSLIFFVEMLWSGIAALGPASRQLEPAFNLSLVWGFLAIPVGFTLMIYHMLVLMVLDRRAIAATATGSAAS